MNKPVKAIEKKFIVYSSLFSNAHSNHFLSNHNISYKKYHLHIKRLFFNSPVFFNIERQVYFKGHFLFSTKVEKNEEQNHLLVYKLLIKNLCWNFS